VSDIQCERALKQYAVYWPFAGYDDDGDPEVGTAVEIKCRWEEGLREVTGSQEGPIGSSDTVFVDRDLTIDSFLWRGRLADLATPTPNRPANQRVIIDFNKTPDLKNRKYTRTVSLLKR